MQTATVENYRQKKGRETLFQTQEEGAARYIPVGNKFAGGAKIVKEALLYSATRR